MSDEGSNPSVSVRQPSYWWLHLPILITAIGLIMLLLGTELTLRVVWGFGNPPLFQADSEIGYLLKANQNIRRFGKRIYINRWHQRSPDYFTQPTANTYRIMVLGDSVTYGMRYDQDQTYTALLEKELRQSNARAEVLNASAGSWAIGNQLGYIKRFGTFNSKVVVLQIGSHDLLQEKSVFEPYRLGKPDRKPMTAIGEWWFNYIWPYLRRLFIRADDRTSPDNLVNLPKKMQFDEEVERFNNNMKDLERIIRKVRLSGASVLVLHTPNRNEVAGKQGVFAQYYVEWHRRFRDYLRELNVPLIDLTADWKGLPEAAVYFADRLHPSLVGNQAISKRLANYLLAQQAEQQL